MRDSAGWKRREAYDGQPRLPDQQNDLNPLQISVRRDVSL